MQELAPALKDGGGIYKYLPVGGEWNPVCMAEKGCEKPECKNTLMCRKEVPGRLEVFVMSQCPYGVKALDAMNEVLKNFGDKLDFVVHFIGENDPAKGLTSMHGQGEIDEDLREACTAKHYPKNFKFMEYMWCRNKDIRGTDAETVRKNVCDHNKGLKGCDAKLTAAQPGAPPEPGCGK